MPKTIAQGYPEFDLDVQLCFPLYAASRAVTARYAVALAGTGLTYPQYLVLLALWGDGSLSVGQLGARLRLDSGTLSPLLKRLEAAGLVRRERDSDDERRVIVTVTDAGWALRERVAGVPRRIASDLGLDADTYHRLRDLLGRVIDHLDNPPTTQEDLA